MVIDLRELERTIKIELKAQEKMVPYLDTYIDDVLEDLKIILEQRKNADKIKIEIIIQ